MQPYCLLDILETFYKKKKSKADSTFPLALVAVSPFLRTHCESSTGVKVAETSVHRVSYQQPKFCRADVDSYDLDDWVKPTGNTFEDTVWGVVKPSFPSQSKAVGITLHVSLPLASCGMTNSLWWVTRGEEVQLELVLNGGAVKKVLKRPLDIQDFQMDVVEGACAQEESSNAVWRVVRLVRCDMDSHSLLSLPFNCLFHRVGLCRVKEIHMEHCSVKFDKTLVNKEAITDGTEMAPYGWDSVEALFLNKCGGEGLWRALSPLIACPLQVESTGDHQIHLLAKAPLRILSLVDCKVKPDTLHLLMSSVSRRNQLLHAASPSEARRSFCFQQLELSFCGVHWPLEFLKNTAFWDLYQDLKVLILTRCEMPSQVLKDSFINLKKWEHVVFRQPMEY
ncbi:hypothetical protein ADEAN_000100500 [Angomonas deanei]|uniref:Uncharacterized protein n=1 Tax=Angomonas deanei TaxID=59799 RepID=A0A7G2C6I6_9TRYP|nr:hypothetical protein ADEAN_000100500 [Angomonas deanei]